MAFGAIYRCNVIYAVLKDKEFYRDSPTNPSIAVEAEKRLITPTSVDGLNKRACTRPTNFS